MDPNGALRGVRLAQHVGEVCAKIGWTSPTNFLCSAIGLVMCKQLFIDLTKLEIKKFKEEFNTEPTTWTNEHQIYPRKILGRLAFVHSRLNLYIIGDLILIYKNPLIEYQ